MNEKTGQPIGAHVVGRVPLDGPEDVFRTVSSHLGQHVRSIPDGETETFWIGAVFGLLDAFPALERRLLDDPTIPFRFALKEGVGATDLDLPELGYAAVARRSFEIFSALKRDGEIRADVRFQVNLPSPATLTWATIHEDARGEIEPAFERAIAREVRQLADSIPHGELTIGIDIPVEIVTLEGGYSEWWTEPTLEDAILGRLIRLADLIPGDVPLGFHVCLGSRGDKHSVVPRDASKQVHLLNRMFSELPHATSWVHVPVPSEADADAYLAPYRDLRLPEDTWLFLGLVGRDGELADTEERIGAAKRYLPRFGVATVCGLSNEHYSRDLTIHILDAQAKAAEPIVA